MDNWGTTPASLEQGFLPSHVCPGASSLEQGAAKDLALWCWCLSDSTPQAGQLGLCLIPEKIQVPMYSLSVPVSPLLSYASPPGVSALVF